jgi:Tetracyclin repressor-like, C-terminal domain
MRHAVCSGQPEPSRGLGTAAPARRLHGTVTGWASAHGMIMLELNGRFPPDADLDAAWRAGIAAFRAPG